MNPTLAVACASGKGEKDGRFAFFIAQWSLGEWGSGRRTQRKKIEGLVGTGEGVNATDCAPASVRGKKGPE